MSTEKPAASATRIYTVKGPDKETHLVRAGNPAQAIRHVVRKKYTASVSSQDDLVAFLGKQAVEAAATDAE